jgi:hypothetical protein
MNEARVLAFRTVAISALAVLLCACPLAAGEEANVELRQHIVSFLQRGGRLEELPANHPLLPLARAPLIASTSYLLLRDDLTALTRYYPEISRNVLGRIDRDRTTESGLLPGSVGGEGGPEVYLSPTLNALVGLELYSLHLIASRIGLYEEAYDLLSWSRIMAEATTRSFYDPSRNFFFPLDANGYMKVRYDASLALPLVLDRTLGQGARRRVVEKLGSAELQDQVWGSVTDDVLYPVVCYLLSRGAEVGCVPEGALRMPPSERGPWHRFWANGPPAAEGLFPPSHDISSLVHLIAILERESLMESDTFTPFKGDVDSLVAFLGSDALEIDSYIGAINTVNRLLAAVSSFSTNLDSKTDRWRAVQEYKWSRLSPRLRRIVIESARTALEELRRTKPVLSARFMERSSFFSRVSFPTRPLAQAKQFEFTASLLCRRDSLSFSRLYIGVGEQRIKVTEDKPAIPLSPSIGPFSYEGVVSLPPTAQPGIMSIPVYLDFLIDGRRVELHHTESVTLTRGHDISLNFPSGKRLIGTSIPIDIVLRHSPERNLQGSVEGAFMKELNCAPELPAKFSLKKGTDATTLPLTLSFGAGLPPGRYPFSLRVFLDGKQVAFFEDALVRPIRWFHLGPLAGRERLLEEGVAYQDDLFGAHGGSGDVEWREVPAGALDGQGAVLPARLTGRIPRQCSLLYTVVDSPTRQKAVWSLTTGNVSSLWVNGEPVVTSSSSPFGEKTGTIDLRKGSNSIFLTCCWEEEPQGLYFTLSDESGLPVPGLRNDIERIVEGFERLSTQSAEKKPSEQAKDKPFEVVLTLKRPHAEEVCVIGSFNNWQPGATPMRKGPDGVWTARFFLPAGRYVYKFLVDGNTRIPDPNARQREADGFGGLNSVLEVR